jgi:hypothetical protein
LPALELGPIANGLGRWVTPDFVGAGLDNPTFIGLQRNTVMLALATLALGLAFFGLFFALVVACDQL